MHTSNSYKIFQAQILAKDPITPRQYTVVQIPEGYKMVGVQLPNALKDQSAPLLGSIVLILQLDAYRSYILMVLREPYKILDSNQQFRGFIPSTGNAAQDIQLLSNPIQDGEVYMEATGPLSPTGQVTPGFGAHLYLGNNGSAQIESGSMGEKLVIGGVGTDDDHEVVLSADNGFIESNPNEITNIQSTFNWDDLNNLQVGNVVADPLSTETIPISELTMDSLGQIVLRNTTLGVDKGSLKIDAVGNMSLNTVSDMTLSANLITLNSGTLGAARIADPTISNTATDPQYWLFVNALQAFFTSISVLTGGAPVTQSQLGALGLAFLAQVPLAPSSITSKISSGSDTVFIG